MQDRNWILYANISKSPIKKNHCFKDLAASASYFRTSTFWRECYLKAYLSEKWNRKFQRKCEDARESFSAFARQCARENVHLPDLMSDQV